MVLEESQFIKNKENDVFDRGTKGERLLILFVRIFTIVGSCWLISRLITKPENLGNWYDAFLIFVLSAPNVILLLGGEEAKRKKYIKKGQKIAAKLIDVEARQCEEGERKYTDYIARFQCLANSKEYVVHFDNLDPREYIANPYCNLYIYQKKRKCIVAVKDFCIKSEHLSKSGYFLVK